MYRKKAVKTLQKQPPVITSSNSTRDADSDVQFELELCWCVHQLEDALNSRKLNKKIEEDTIKNLRTLQSKNAPLIKKRQVMKAAFGDYRTKMQEEEKKLRLAAQQVKFTTPTDIVQQHSFLKKSALLSSGKDFRFNFETENNCSESSAAKENAEATDLNSNSSSVGGFRFNFNVDETNDQLNIAALTLKD